jgi:hypothetical protein
MWAADHFRMDLDMDFERKPSSDCVDRRMLMLRILAL